MATSTILIKQLEKRMQALDHRMKDISCELGVLIELLLLKKERRKKDKQGEQ